MFAADTDGACAARLPASGRGRRHVPELSPAAETGDPTGSDEQHGRVVQLLHDNAADKLQCL